MTETSCATQADSLLGRLLDRFEGPAIEEIMINGPGPVWIERAGKLVSTDVVLDERSIELLVEHIVAPLGLRADRSAPIVNARLADGSRVNIVMPPLALAGPTVSIRRFASTRLGLDAFGPADLVPILANLVEQRHSVLVVGPTSSGKTSLLGAMAGHIPESERLVVIEDTAELPLTNPHQVRLESRPANSEGVGEVAIRTLVLTAMRMRPDRLVVGEVRGGEAFDLLLALTSGHKGCLTTCHGAGVAHGIRRLGTLAGLAASGLNPEQIMDLILDGLDAVIVTGRVGRFRGVRQVASIDPDAGIQVLWPPAEVPQ